MAGPPFARNRAPDSSRHRRVPPHGCTRTGTLPAVERPSRHMAFTNAYLSTFVRATFRIYLLTTCRSRAKKSPSSLIEGRLRRHPEGGAGSGVLRRRLVTARPGRSGKSPARHYDLAARSSLHGSGRQLPAVVGRRAPKETEARPRGPKPPRWSAERRASRVIANLRSMALHGAPCLLP